MFRKHMKSVYKLLGKNVYAQFGNDARCELTSKRYNVKRKPYKLINSEDIGFFKDVLGKNGVLKTNSLELDSFNIDWANNFRGESSVILKPKSTTEISKILSYCNNNKIAVCPQGGNTSIVGGSVPLFDEVILSLRNMNKISSVDIWSGVCICEPGCILENLDNHVAQHNLMVPLDLGAKGSCMIGGNVSTNAGGIRYLKYGSLHGSVLGVEAVLPSGEIVDCMSSMKKDNTGYGLKHLFIGSEGSLGIITKIAIQCPTRPASRQVAFMALNSFQNCVDAYVNARKNLSEILSACEFADHISMDAVSQNLNIKNPCEGYPFYVFIETSGSNSNHDKEKLTNFLNEQIESGVIEDCVLATEPSKMHSIWQIREEMPTALIKDGYMYNYDVSVPVNVSYELVEVFQERLRGKVKRCTGFGHLGDGNLHLTITGEEFKPEILEVIEPLLYEIVAKYNGSVSAEHGVGFWKKDFISYTKSPATIRLMYKLKNLFDHNHILNPYKIFSDNFTN